MNNTEKEQLAVKAFYYTKASEVGFKEANKLIQYLAAVTPTDEWLDVNCDYDFLQNIPFGNVRIKPTKVKTMVDIWVKASVEVEHEEGTNPEDVMHASDVYYHTGDGDKQDLGGNYTYTTDDMVLIERDKLSALYNSVVEYSDKTYTSDSNSGDWYIVEDIKNQYNL